MTESNEKEPSSDLSADFKGGRLKMMLRLTLARATLITLAAITTVSTTAWGIWRAKMASIDADHQALMATTRDVAELKDESAITMSRVNQDHDAITRMAAQMDWFYKITGGPLFDKAKP